jgi:hypothetical protein
MVSADRKTRGHETSRSSVLANTASSVGVGRFLLGPTQHELKLAAVFAEVVEQASQEGFFGKLERRGKLLRQPRDVAEMLGQGLPFFLWQAVALIVFSRVRETFHAHLLTMLPPGRGSFITPDRE